MLEVSVVSLLQLGPQKRPVADSKQKVPIVLPPSAGFARVCFIGQDGDDGSDCGKS